MACAHAGEATNHTPKPNNMITSVYPGCYRQPLSHGLIAVHQTALAEAVLAGDIKLGIRAQMRACDRVRDDLASTCINALMTEQAAGLAAPAVLGHYIDGLKDGRICVAHPGNFTPTINTKNWAPGELFFKS